MSDNARYWTAILYPEHLIEGWQNKIQDMLEVAYCYCIHDKDTRSFSQLVKVSNSSL